MGEDRPLHSRLREPSQLRPDRRVADQRSALVPPHERPAQRRTVPDVERRAREHALRLLEGNDVAGIDEDLLSGFDPNGRAGASNGMSDRDRLQAKRSRLPRVAGKQDDPPRDRKVFEDLVRLAGGVDGNVRPVLEAPGVIGMSVRDVDRIGADLPEQALPVLAEVAEQPKAPRRDREGRVAEVRRRVLFDVSLRAEELEVHAESLRHSLARVFTP